MSKPTIVLVHGAFADASAWSGVTPMLWERGYDVIAAPNLLRDLDGDAEYVKTIVRDVQGPVVLVGHSYAGAVITRAAQDLPNVQSLVYVAAYQPDTGEDVFTLSGPDTKLGEKTSTPVVHDGEPELRVNADSFGDVLAGDVDPQRVRFLAASQRPTALKALTGALEGEPAWKKLPSWALLATADRAIPLSQQEFMAERAGSTISRVESSHAVAISHPEAVTDVIVAAATA